MDMLLKLISAMVIVCLLGTMLYATKALKARKSGNPEDKKKNLTLAGCCFAAYCVCNIVRWIVESKVV